MFPLLSNSPQLLNVTVPVLSETVTEPVGPNVIVILLIVMDPDVGQGDKYGVYFGEFSGVVIVKLPALQPNAERSGVQLILTEPFTHCDTL